MKKERNGNYNFLFLHKKKTKMENNENTVERKYSYKTKNGKDYIVKRKYTVKADRIVKNNELDEYFKYHIDELTSKKKLKDIVDEYNSNHSKVSYAKFYLKYKAVFGYRKNRKENTNEDSNIITSSEGDTNEEEDKNKPEQ